MFDYALYIFCLAGLGPQPAIPEVVDSTRDSYIPLIQKGVYPPPTKADGRPR